MVDSNGKTYSVQTIGVPLKVGSRVTLFQDPDIDEEEGLAAVVSFEDYVAQYVPETGLLRFENSDIGRAEFISMVDEADGIEIIHQ
jgi:hypothetical protein